MVIGLNAKILNDENADALSQSDSDAERIAHACSGGPLPGVLFSMRYPNDEGYVWNTIAQGKDKAGLHLVDRAQCLSPIQSCRKKRHIRLNT